METRRLRRSVIISSSPIDPFWQQFWLFTFGRRCHNSRVYRTEVPQGKVRPEIPPRLNANLICMKEGRKEYVLIFFWSPAFWSNRLLSTQLQNNSNNRLLYWNQRRLCSKCLTGQHMTWIALRTRNLAGRACLNIADRDGFPAVPDRSNSATTTDNN